MNQQIRHRHPTSLEIFKAMFITFFIRSDPNFFLRNLSSMANIPNKIPGTYLVIFSIPKDSSHRNVELEREKKTPLHRGSQRSLEYKFENNHIE